MPPDPLRGVVYLYLQLQHVIIINSCSVVSLESKRKLSVSLSSGGWNILRTINPI